MHQQSPPGLQANSVPQREQARRRAPPLCRNLHDGTLRNAVPDFHAGFISNGGIVPAPIQAQGKSGRSPNGPRFAQPRWLRSIASGSARAAAPPAISSMPPPIRASFVKAELSQARSAMLEVPGLQPTPRCWRKAIFEYQFEVQQARAAAKAGAAPSAESPPQSSPDTKPPQRRNLSLSDLAQQISPKDPAMQSAGKLPRSSTRQPWKPCRQPRLRRNRRRRSSTSSRRSFAKRPWRAYAAGRPGRPGRAARCLLVEPFLHLGGKGGIARMAGCFEREAIRPHVLGRFADMLMAVEQHPAMLFYLDNQRSVGPNSRAGQKRQARPQRKSRPRDDGTAHARRRQRLHARRT